MFKFLKKGVLSCLVFISCMALFACDVEDDTGSEETRLEIAAINDSENNQDNQVIENNTTFDMGEVYTGVEKNVTYKIKNISDQNVTVNNIRTKNDLEEYSVTTEKELPIILASGEELNYTIKIAATSATELSDEILIESDDPEFPEFSYTAKVKSVTGIGRVYVKIPVPVHTYKTGPVLSVNKIELFKGEVSLGKKEVYLYEDFMPTLEIENLTFGKYTIKINSRYSVRSENPYSPDTTYDIKGEWSFEHKEDIRNIDNYLEMPLETVTIVEVKEIGQVYVKIPVPVHTYKGVGPVLSVNKIELFKDEESLGEKPLYLHDDSIPMLHVENLKFGNYTIKINSRYSVHSESPYIPNTFYDVKGEWSFEHAEEIATVENYLEMPAETVSIEKVTGDLLKIIISGEGAENFVGNEITLLGEGMTPLEKYKSTVKVNNDGVVYLEFTNVDALINYNIKLEKEYGVYIYYTTKSFEKNTEVVQTIEASLEKTYITVPEGKGSVFVRLEPEKNCPLIGKSVKVYKDGKFLEYKTVTSYVYRPIVFLENYDHGIYTIEYEDSLSYYDSINHINVAYVYTGNWTFVHNYNMSDPGQSLLMPAENRSKQRKTGQVKIVLTGANAQFLVGYVAKLHYSDQHMPVEGYNGAEIKEENGEVFVIYPKVDLNNQFRFFISVDSYHASELFTLESTQGMTVEIEVK